MPTRAHTRPLRLSIALLTVLTAVVFAPSSAPKAAAETTSWLPFDKPSKTALQASPRKVFANWVVALPRSIDNRPPDRDYYQVHYLNPMGEGGKHKAYGGHLRDRPLGRAPLTTSAWKLEDMKVEVRNAIAAGLDGFTVVLYSVPARGTTTTMWEHAKLMLQAAAAVDPAFKIIPMPDVTVLTTIDPATLAFRMAELGRYSAAYKVDYKMVLSAFTAERKSVSWWSSVLNTIRNTHKVPVAFFPLIQDIRTYGASFAPITYGMADWGLRDPTANDPNSISAYGPVGRIDRVQAMGDKWMQPISVQDERPRRGIYWEAGNTENLRNTWEIVRKGGADWAQLVTWNDLIEGSGMLPSVKHGYSFLDINAYYITWFKTGVAPRITRDAVYLTHRKQKMSAPITFPQTLFMTTRRGMTPGRDTVEALTFSKAAGTVQITVGTQKYSCAVDAGVDTCTVPLSTGTVSAKLIRSGTAVATLTSPYQVSGNPYVQDFEYTGSSSLRQGTSATAPATSSPVTTSSTVTLAASADSVVESLKPEANQGTNQTLVADGLSTKMSYMRFNLPTAPSGRRLIGATLKVRTTSAWYAGSPSAYAVKPAGNAWSETDIKWTNRPAVSTSIGSLTATAPGTTYSSSLSAASLGGLLGQQITLAVSGSAVDGIFFASRESSDVASRPQLVLTFG